ncbi:MAG: NAD-dependent epimerase/dehydratase family protein [Brevinematales bacterium]|nr:NAD-dependent epimerase/dehydratase family protein [Brevinematales bacterium]
MGNTALKVLVTGGTGFIGPRLIEELVRRGYSVRCLRRVHNKHHPNNLPDSVEIFEGDLFDKEMLCEAVEGIDIIYHTAALVKALGRKEFYSVNVTGTLNLLDAVAKCETRLKRFVFFSSQAAGYPASDALHPAQENNACAPVSLYGKSKAAAEALVRCHPANIPYTIIRPVSVYGPGDREFFKYYNSIAMFHLKPVLGLGKRQLNLIYIFDLINAAIDASLSEKTAGKTYFLANETNYTWRGFADTLSKVMGIRAKFFFTPPILFRIWGLFSDIFAKVTGRSVFFSGSKVNESIKKYWLVSCQEARKDFGFKCDTELEQGLAETLKWYKEHGWLK